MGVPAEGPQGFGDPIELEEPREVAAGSPGIGGFRGVPGGSVSPSPLAQRQAWVRGGGRAWCRSRTCCTSCSRDSPGGAPPFPQPHFTPWTAGEGGKNPSGRGGCAVHSLSSSPKEPHTPPAPLHPTGKGQIPQEGGFGVPSPTAQKRPHSAPVLLHPTGGKITQKGASGASSPSPAPLYPVDFAKRENKPTAKGDSGHRFPPSQNTKLRPHSHNPAPPREPSRG